MSKLHTLYIITFRGLSGPMQQTVLSELTPAQWAFKATTEGLSVMWAKTVTVEEARYAGFTKTYEGTSLIENPKGVRDEE